MSGQRGSARPGRRRTRGPHYLGVGCFTVFAGFAGGGMIAVLIAKIVGFARRCPSRGRDRGAVQLVHVSRCSGRSRAR